jgi:hypothetical protein
MQIGVPFVIIYNSTPDTWFDFVKKDLGLEDTEVNSLRNRLTCIEAVWFDNDHQFYKSIESKNKDQSKNPLRVLDKVETNQKPIKKRPYHYTLQGPPMPYDLQEEYDEENEHENDSGTSSTFLN